MTKEDLRAWQKKHGFTAIEACEVLAIKRPRWDKWVCGKVPVPSIVARLIQVLEELNSVKKQ